MKLETSLKWKELCEETGHEDWAHDQGGKLRQVRFRQIQKEYIVEKLENVRGRYIIHGIGETPGLYKTFPYQSIQPGQVFGRLTTIEPAEDKGDKYEHLWLCQCECGNLVYARAQEMLRGAKKSCGCLRKNYNFDGNGRSKIAKSLVTFEDDPELFKEQQRKLFSCSLRYKILKRDNFRCKYCGRGVEDGVKLNVDHIIPISKGGKTEESNLQTLCWECNIGKFDDNPLD